MALIPRYFWISSVLALLLMAGCGASKKPGGAMPVQTAHPATAGATARHHFLAATRAEADGDLKTAAREMELALKADPRSNYLKVQTANLALRQGDQDRAYELLTDVLEDSPANSEALVLMGRILYARGQRAKAEKAFRTVLDAQPEDSHDLYVFLGLMYTDAQDSGHAVEIFQEGLDHFPESPQLHYYLGLLYAREELWSAAERHLNKALRVAPHFRSARMELARMYAARGDLDRAIAEYRDMVEANPADAEARAALMFLLASQNRFGEVEQTVRTADELGVSSPGLQEGLARLYLARGETDKAIKELEVSIGQFPDNHQARRLLGTLYMREHKYERGLAVLDDIPESSPYYLEAQTQIAFIHKNAGDLGKAIAALERVYARYPDNAQVAMSMAALYREDARYKDAARVLEATLAQHPDDINVRASLAMNLYAQGKVDKSIAVMQEVLDADPDNVTALNFIGYTWAEQGINLDTARTMIEQALEQEPNDGAIIDSMGWVLYQQGEYETAVKYLERAVMLTPEDPLVQEHLGDAYRAVDKIEPAKFRYEHALTLDPDKKHRRRIEKKLRALHDVSR